MGYRHEILVLLRTNKLQKLFFLSPERKLSILYGTDGAEGVLYPQNGKLSILYGPDGAEGVLYPRTAMLSHAKPA